MKIVKNATLNVYPGAPGKVLNAHDKLDSEIVRPALVCRHRDHTVRKIGAGEGIRLFVDLSFPFT